MKKPLTPREFVEGPYDPTWNPICKACQTGRMQIHTASIRTPERWLKCDACGMVEDVTIDQYFMNEPAPDWFNQGTFRPYKV